MKNTNYEAPYYLIFSVLLLLPLSLRPLDPWQLTEVLPLELTHEFP
jgi:hypothetical protein